MIEINIPRKYDNLVDKLCGEVIPMANIKNQDNREHMLLGLFKILGFIQRHNPWNYGATLKWDGEKVTMEEYDGEALVYRANPEK